MKQNVEPEMEIKRYLLGDLNLEEQVLIEQRLFLDSEYAELAQSVEDDLIDEYVYDDLSGSEREKFESHFLERPEHKDNLRIAQALKKQLNPESDVHPVKPIPVDPVAKRNPIVWFALAATVLILIAWFGIRSVRRGGSEQPLQVKETPPVQSSPNNEPLPSPALPVNREERVEQRDNGSNEKPPQHPSVLATLLPGGGSRGPGQATKLTIPSTVENVTLRLPVILKSYDRYRFELARDGQTIHAGDLKPQVEKKWGQVVFITVPTKLLTEQTYEITLHGLTSSGPSADETIYSFMVLKQQ